MSTGGLIFFVMLLAGTILLAGAPLLRRETESEADALQIQKQRERLLVYYERVLTNLRDLDEDHATGKMPDDAYASEREDWVQRGIEVLKTLDELADHSVIPASVHDDAAVDEAIDDAIEAAIAARRRAARPAN